MEALKNLIDMYDEFLFGTKSVEELRLAAKACTLLDLNTDGSDTELVESIKYAFKEAIKNT